MGPRELGLNSQSEPLLRSRDFSFPKKIQLLPTIYIDIHHYKSIHYIAYNREAIALQ